MSFTTAYLSLTAISLWFTYLIIKEERRRPTDMDVLSVVMMILFSVIPLLNVMTAVGLPVLYFYMTRDRGLGRFLSAKIGKSESSK